MTLTLEIDAGGRGVVQGSVAWCRAAWRGAASLHHRSRTTTTVLVCEQKSYPVSSHDGVKIRYSVNMALIVKT